MPKGLLRNLKMIMILSIIIPVTAAMAAEKKIPRISLSVKFDLTAGVMRGEAIIDLPASSPGEIFFPGLEVKKILVNGKEINAENGAGIYFENDHVLSLPTTTDEKTINQHGWTNSGASATTKDENSLNPRHFAGDFRIKITYRYRPRPDELLGRDQIYLHGPWHPYLDTEALFSLKALLPGGFHGISQAEEIIEKKGKNGTVTEFTFPYPQRTIDLIAGPYQLSRVKIKNGPDLYACFFPEDQDLVKDYLEKGAAYIKRYQELIGPFPYKRFSIVENRLPTGFAMPTFTLLGQQVARLPFITTTSLGHEILHQWFGNAVAVANESGNWCEGLVTCLADQSYAADQGRGARFRKNQILRYESFVNKGNAISLEQFLGGKSHLLPGQAANRAVGYAKAGMLFHMLRKRIGDKAFYKGLRLFYARFKYHSAQWSDIETVFSETSGKKLDIFFTGWLGSRDIPRLSVTGLRVRENGGKVRLSFDLRQISGKPQRMTVPYRVITPSATLNRDIELTDKLFHVDLDLDDYPDEIIIDPEYDLMRHLAPSELPPVWSRVMGARKKIFVIKDKKTEEKFAAFLERFRGKSDQTLSDREADDRKLENADLIFIDASGNKARAMFAGNNSPEHGFSLEVKANPLSSGRTATLINAADSAEVRAATRKLSHYGKYSRLAFDNGGIKIREVASSADGIHYRAAPEPAGFEVRPPLKFSGIMAKIADRKVVYVGESHTSPADHHLQIRVIRAMYAQDKDLAIGMEMFSHEAQTALDRYIIKKEIDEKEFLRQCDYFKRWGYDFRFYRPILDFARAKGIPVIALNQPKPTVSKIYSSGIAALSEKEKKGLPEERDLTLPGYRQRLNRIFHMHRGKGRLNDFIEAQTIWDETMAATAAGYLQKHPDARMVILAGRGHVEKNAIPPRLTRRTGLPQVVLLNNDQSGNAAAIADFVLSTRARPLPGLPLMGVMLEEVKGGIKIVRVNKDSPAAKAGVKKNDLILTADGEKVTDINDIKVLMLYKKKGDGIKLRLKREHLMWPTTTGVIDIKL